MPLSPWENHCFDWESVRGIELIPTIVYRGKVPASGANAHLTPLCYTWWWIHQGEVFVKTNEEVLRVRAGQWILLPPGLRRLQQFRLGSKIISINFFARWSHGLPLVDMRSLLVSESGAVPALLALAIKVCKTSKADQWPHHITLNDRKLAIADALQLNSALNCFVRVLLGHAIKFGAHLKSFAVADGQVGPILQIVRSELRAGPLPYRQWQQKTGLTRSQLDRQMRAHLRMSLRRYRDRLLMAEACRLLASQKTVKYTAAKLGFVDSAHLCRWFRRHSGRTPLSARNGPMPI